MLPVQAMDPLKAEQLQSALQSTGETTLLGELQQFTSRICTVPAESDAVAAATAQEPGCGVPSSCQTETRQSAAWPTFHVASPQLSQSVLDASANVLRTLVRPISSSYLSVLNSLRHTCTVS